MKSLKSFFSNQNTPSSSNDVKSENTIWQKANIWLISPICIGISLWLIMIPYRGRQIGYTMEIMKKYPSEIFKIINATYYDLLLVLGMVLLFSVIGFLLRKSPTATRINHRIFIFLAIFVQGFSIASLAFQQKVKVQLTYQWLLYSDIFNSTDAQNAVKANFDAAILWDFLIIISFILAIPIFLRWAVYKTNISKYFPWAILVVNMIFLTISANFINKTEWTDSQLNNAALVFVESTPMFQEQPGLFSVEVSEEDLNKQREAHTAPVMLPPLDSTIKNVVLIVLESVQASYLEVYGNQLPITPNIKRFEDRSMQISNAYAHIPSTNRAMFTTFSSLYPQISYYSVTSHSTNLKTPTINSVLSQEGYRTSFFTSADNRFQHIDEYLANNDFQTIKDLRNIECDSVRFNDSESGWQYLEGIKDVCIGGAFDQWLDEEKDQPFFSVLWTVQTHYPYYTTGEIAEYDTVNTLRNQYMNALKEGDQLFGNVMDLLIEKGLDKNTLVVLMGDHGEAFLTHNQGGHANEVYEENIHIPLIFYHPTLFSGDKKELVAGQIDIAPSIMHMLGIDAPEVWQGESVFLDDFRNNAYAFTLYGRFVFGYREGKYKVIYDAGADSFEVYDIKADPQELHNIANQHAELTKRVHQQFASWIKYNDQVLTPILETSK